MQAASSAEAGGPEQLQADVARGGDDVVGTPVRRARERQQTERNPLLSAGTQASCQSLPPAKLSVSGPQA